MTPVARPVTVTRFAPSPTGLLHLGHAYSAMLAHDAARNAPGAVGGRFLLRIEDIDVGRCREEFVAAIEADLAWLGLDWERPVRRQSEHMADYRAALDRLEAMGLLYPCFLSRKELDAALSAPHFRAMQGPEGPVRSMPTGCCRRPSGRPGWRPVSPTPCGCGWRRRWSGPAR